MIAYSSRCSFLLLLLLSGSCLGMHYRQQEDNKLLSCPVGFSLHNSFCYKFFGTKTRQTFYHALKRCSADYATLVSVHSAEEQDFVIQLTGNNTAFWLGLKDFVEQDQSLDGVFEWTTGQILDHSVSYHKWKPGEPINHKHTDCVKCDYYGWSVAQGGCGACKLPYICKKQACPENYEWRGRSCELTIHTATTTTSFSSSHLKNSRTTLLFPLVLVLVLVCSILVYYILLRTRTGSSNDHESYLSRVQFLS